MRRTTWQWVATGIAARGLHLLVGAVPLAIAGGLVWVGLRALPEGRVQFRLPGRWGPGVDLGEVPALAFTVVAVVLSAAALAWLIGCAMWPRVPMSFVVGLPTLLTAGWGTLLTGYVIADDPHDAERILGAVVVLVPLTGLAFVAAMSSWRGIRVRVLRNHPSL